MMHRVFSACPQGVSAVPITVEADVRVGGSTRVSIVGLPDTATRESKDRLIPAITNSGFALESGTIIINLSPADLPKEGMAYDLPMAVAILAARQIIPSERVEGLLLLGELALDGTVRPVPSVLASAECAREQGIDTLIVPKGNGQEAYLVEGLTIYEVAHLKELVKFLRGREAWEPFTCDRQVLFTDQGEYEAPDLRDVRGQANVKRVLEIAAAGHHNLLLFGPPGSGKSMLSKRLPGIMPPMRPEEIIEVTRIYSASGRLRGGGSALVRRPFRAPHHTASPIAMIGGGAYPKPGEVTRAHRGVLFLDEFPEFPRSVLEVLRQPLEDRQVTISRASQQVTFPADFLLVAAMNPCPCGWRGDRRRPCRCTEPRIQQYRARLSGPLLDRIDLHVEVPSLAISTIRKLPPAETSERVRQRVLAARAIQTDRYGSSLLTNASMPPSYLEKYCPIDDELARLLEEKVEACGYSKRVHDKVIRVARTIADLAGSPQISADHLLESLAYRQLDVQTVGVIVPPKTATQVPEVMP